MRSTRPERAEAGDGAVGIGRMADDGPRHVPGSARGTADVARGGRCLLGRPFGRAASCLGGAAVRESGDGGRPAPWRGRRARASGARGSASPGRVIVDRAGNRQGAVGHSRRRRDAQDAAAFCAVVDGRCAGRASAPCGEAGRQGRAGGAHSEVRGLASCRGRLAAAAGGLRGREAPGRRRARRRPGPRRRTGSPDRRRRGPHPARVRRRDGPPGSPRVGTATSAHRASPWARPSGRAGAGPEADRISSARRR